MITNKKYAESRGKLLIQMRKLIIMRDDISFKIKKIRREMQCLDNILVVRERK